MLRTMILSAEPLAFKAIRPLLAGRKNRYVRSMLVQKYCSGHGAEIGAGVSPFLVPLGSRTTYIDAVPASYWRKLPMWADEKVLDAEIIDEAATLEKIGDATFDYLVAAHVLEHIDDPIRALKNWTRVVRPGGHIVIAVPDKRFCGEEARELTTLEHMQRDHMEGPHVSARQHYDEHHWHFAGLEGEALAAAVKENERNIHYHTFTLTSFVQILGALQDIGFELVEACLNVNEDIAVLKRIGVS